MRDFQKMSEIKTWLCPESGLEGQAGSRVEYRVKRCELLCTLVAEVIRTASSQSSLCRGRSISGAVAK